MRKCAKRVLTPPMGLHMDQSSLVDSIDMCGGV